MCEQDKRFYRKQIEWCIQKDNKAVPNDDNNEDKSSSSTTSADSSSNESNYENLPRKQKKKDFLQLCLPN